ncbi:MAG: IS21 family transposase [Betaproteobacteria bacterium]|nr:IS21 family transposase [Betaproteobacteria bacterium]
MPAKRMNLRMIKDVLRLKYEAGLSHQQIARALRISKGVVAKYVAAAEAAGLTDWALLREMGEAVLEGRLLVRRASSHAVAMPDFGRVHQELGRKGVTLALLWEEYAAAHPGQRTWGRTQFYEHYRRFAGTLKRSMRQVHRAGEKLFVDYAGPTVALRDGTRASVFVAAMGASSYTFACATPGQKLEDWITGLVRALHFLGGVPPLIVPDNARALIAEPDRYEPRAGATVLDFARHYATSILPARPRAPQDKAKVESAVQVVERWILARLRHRRFDSVFDLDSAIAQLLPELNERPFQRLPGSRASTFAEIDRPALQPLPRSRYEIARFKRARVHIDYHVQVEGHFYSVPHALVGQEIEVRITVTAIECLHRGRRVAAHARSTRQGAYTTVAEHLPAAHRAHLEWTPTRLIEWGRRIGVACAEVVERMLAQHKHPEHGYRRCLGLLSLARKYGPQRLEAACALALQLGSCRYRSVRDILANHRDRSPGSDEGEWTSPSHENVRGPGYYQ